MNGTFRIGGGALEGMTGGGGEFKIGWGGGIPPKALGKSGEAAGGMVGMTGGGGRGGWPALESGGGMPP